MMMQDRVNFQKRNKRVALMLNIIAPYRIPIIRHLSKEFEIKIMISGEESNRKEWNDYIQNELEKLSIQWEPVWGLTIVIPRLFGGKLFDWRFVHINPGYFGSLLRFRPDAVISNEMGFRSAIALLYGFLFLKPVWIWWGGTLHTERSVGLLKRLWRRFLAKVVKRWISYGQTSTEYLQSIGVPKGRILQIQNCIDENLFKQKAVPLLEIEPKPVLLFVGQLIKRKGVDLLLEAASKVQKRGYSFSLVLVGSGPEQDKLKALAQSLGLRNVHFLKEYSPVDMPRVYRSANVVVFPTLEDVWGLVVNEALWSGVPVLASKYAGCTPEILPETNVFDPLSPEEFEMALEKAVRGEIAPPDVSRLLPCERVAQLLIEDI